jgi:F0F1-type ATP synthase delta subunit
MKLKLPDSVSSPQDLTALLLEVQEYARWFAHEAVKKRVNAKHGQQAPVMSPMTTEFLRTWRAESSLTAQSLASLVKSLEDYKKTAPSLTLTLAAPPTSDVKRTLVAWCRINIAPNILVNFQFNTTLLGGMVIRYGSRVLDWSFRRQILDARGKFPEVLRRV